MADIRVLIVDDSKIAQEMVSDLLAGDKDMKIVGVASDGSEAVGKALALKPSVITMDINMPVMDGLEAIEKIMAYNPCPIIVLTDANLGAVAFQAVSKGALEVFSKSDFSLNNGADFANKVKMLSKVKVIRHIRSKKRSKPPVGKPTATPKISGTVSAVAIASSTGGPKALSIILQEIPATFPAPILVAQHIGRHFVDGLIEWLNIDTPLNIKKGEDGEKVVPGNVYISPTSKNMRMDRGARIVLEDHRPDDIYYPSCNLLLSSVAKTCGKTGVGIILTGMGSDGAEGIRKIKEAGGVTFAQDEESSVVFGMPNVAIQSGYVDKVLPLNFIAANLNKLAGKTGVDILVKR